MTVETRDLTHDLLAKLRGAPTFEAASDALLDALFDHVLRTVGASPEPALLRGGIYLHGDRGFRGALCRSVDGRSTSEGRLPSRTALRMAEALGEPVFLNLELEEVAPARWDHEAGARPDPAEVQSFGSETRGLRSRTDATHIYALPLRRTDRVEGVVTLEWRCRDELGMRLGAWEAVEAGARLAVDLAAPILLSRPFAEVRSADLALGLPVIGATMRPILTQLAVYAQREGTILLGGPTGAGKTSLAEWVHTRSARFKGPFRTLHLQNMNAETATAYLFGWTEGAFTGAHRSYAGEVAQAEGGTLFLDEIGLLPMELQGQLLQFLQTRRFRRRGHRGDDATADVRIVSATNVDLERAVEEGRFRLDLYRRLAQRPVEIPGLDERRDEIPGWALLAARRYHRGLTGRADVNLSAEAVTALCARSWPGNLHELVSAVECAYELATPSAVGGAVLIEADHVAFALSTSGRRGRPGRLVAALKGAANAWLDAMGEGSPEALAWSEAGVTFRSALLQAAIERWGSPAAFHRLGETARVKSNNHSKEATAARKVLEAFSERIKV